MRKLVDRGYLARVSGTALGMAGSRVAARVLRLARGIPPVLALRSKRGVTAIEYGLIAALIAVAIIVAVSLVGTNLQLTFNTIAGHLGSSPH